MIDARAVVAPTAQLADDVEVGPYAVIGPNVVLGAGCTVGAHAVITGHTRLGERNHVFQFAAIGEIPQDKKFQGEESRLEVGDDNVFREFCSVHTGTKLGGGVTKIGSRNLIMNYVHVAHDCVLGDDCVLSNYTGLAGHVHIGNGAVFGGFAKVVQFAHIGDYSFISANSDIGKDVLPYIIVSGAAFNIKPYGLNLVGLRRHNFSEETLQQLKRAYQIIFRRGLRLPDILEQLAPLAAECDKVSSFITALEQMGERGFIR